MKLYGIKQIYKKSILTKIIYKTIHIIGSLCVSGSPHSMGFQELLLL